MLICEFAVGVKSISGKPVAVLLGPIGADRAHLYASFHSSRTKTERTGSASSPISRATLADLSGVTPRTQQSYERKADVSVKRNLAVGSPVGAACAQEQAWRQGQVLFPFTDFRGKQGKAGRLITPDSCRTIISDRMLIWVAAAGVIIIANWQTCDRKGTRGMGRGLRWGRCGRGVGWLGKKARQRVVLWGVMEEPV